MHGGAKKNISELWSMKNMTLLIIFKSEEE
jgi:hypothetical protein